MEIEQRVAGSGPRVLRVAAELVGGVAAHMMVRAAETVLGRRPGGLAALGRWGAGAAGRAGMFGAVHAAASARRRVPAYQVATRGARPWRAARQAGSLQAYLSALPVLDKASYIDAHPVPARCRGGRLPVRGVEVDESAGSSGRPYQWVRSRAELDQVEARLAVQAGHQLRFRRHRRIVVLNCFSMGAWATGQSVTGSLRRLGTVKSCGPDPDKVFAAIDLLGTDVCYVVCGYPPFLGSLLDGADRRGLDLSGHELWGFVGGEGMTEVMRRRLERVFRRVLSAYGASDLDIGVAGETELTIALRRAAAEDPDFAHELFGHTGRLPMIFQYDPSTYHVEPLDGELVVTVVRRLLSPRVRYAVHDAGGVLDFDRAVAAAGRRGIALPLAGALRLPMLYVTGRADSTLSHMGANLYPEDVDAALGTLADRQPGLELGAFCLSLADAGDGSTRPVVHVEVGDQDARAHPGLADLVRTGLADWLVSNNRDWAAAAAEDRRALDFQIDAVAPGSGVFEANAHRIKRQYILRGDARHA